MDNRTSRVELLAPAGEWDAFVAAVQNGADAVYIGGTAFSARQYASNFDRDAIARALDYAHLRGARLYVTVNTLIKDAELDKALTYLAELHAAGIDGVITQDLGLAALARQALPGLPLHASTQMTVHNREGVRTLLDLGFSRVVAARELSLEELAVLCQEGTEIEAFVHGALCVCYSGQCLMSSLIGGRSGNRGRCAQPCRLEYALVDEHGVEVEGLAKVGTHLLSPKDLLGINLLPQLVGAGIRSLKIEGRMKRPEYVATVVRIYRAALDRALADPASYQVRSEEHEELEQAFTRGFAPGYLTGNLGRDLMSFQRPSNRGTYLGRVISYDRLRQSAEVRLEAPLNRGDGLEFWVTKGGRTGVVAGSQSGVAGDTVRIKVDGQPRPGDRVFKTSDAALLAAAEASFKSPRELKEIPLTLRLVIRRGEPSVMELRDAEGHVGSATGEFRAEPAQKHPLDEAGLRARLDRFGNTPFVVSDWQIDLEPGLMVPWSELNELRRQALDGLERSRLTRYGPEQGEVREADERVLTTLRELREPGAPGGVARMARSVGKPALSIWVGDRDSLVAALEAGANRLIIGGEIFRGPGRAPGFHTAGAVAEAVKLCHAHGADTVLAFSRILRRDEVLDAARLAEGVLSAPPDERPATLMIANLGLLHLLKGRLDGKGGLWADTPLNIFNRATLGFALHAGLAGATLSPELTLSEAAEIAAAYPGATEVLVQGPVTMMVSEYCAPGCIAGGRSCESACARPCGGRSFGLRDRMGLVFPIFVDTSCRMHIHNPKELCLVDQVPALVKAGFGSLRIEARTHDAGYAAAVVRAYRRALDEQDVDLAALRTEIQPLSPQGITKGHFFRGVE